MNGADIGGAGLPRARLLRSPWLGDIEWSAAGELIFPAGLPGFAEARRMLPVEIPAQRPLMYLHSLERADVCFLTLPVFTINPAFELRLSDDDTLALGISACDPPVIGRDVLCLALLIPFESSVQANLDAPVVINLHRGLGAQCMMTTELPRGRFALSSEGWAPIC